MTRPRIIQVSVIVTALVMLATPQWGRAGYDSASSDVESIRRVSVAIDNAFAAGDAAAMAALATEDSVWMPPDEQAITGRDAIQKRYLNMFDKLRSRFNEISHSLEVDDVRVCGDRAVSRGRYRLEMVLRHVPRTVVVTGKNAHTYRRQADGRWLIASNIWNMDEPTRRKAGVEAIKRVNADLIDAFNSGNVSAAVSLVTDDAVDLPPHRPAVIGKEAIRAFVQSDLERFTMRFVDEIVEVETDGDLAVIWSNYKVTLTPRDGGDPINNEGKWIKVLKRQPDGSWKFSRNIWNSDNQQSGN